VDRRIPPLGIRSPAKSEPCKSGFLTSRLGCAALDSRRNGRGNGLTSARHDVLGKGLSKEPRRGVGFPSGAIRENWNDTGKIKHGPCARMTRTDREVKEPAGRSKRAEPAVARSAGHGPGGRQSPRATLRAHEKPSLVEAPQTRLPQPLKRDSGTSMILGL